MDRQLRQYVIRDGRMDEFLALWRDHVVPARSAHGFSVEGAWVNRPESRFVWVVRHPDFAAAEAAYYGSPERAALPQDPAGLLAEVATTMLEGVDGGRAAG